MFLKVEPCASAQGIVSRRGIERACQDHVAFIALCGSTAPHFITIVHFISTLEDAVSEMFRARGVCRARINRREVFAIDGVKLRATPSEPAQYAQCFDAVEPDFGNVRYNKGLDRITVRGRSKVDTQIEAVLPRA